MKVFLSLVAAIGCSVCALVFAKSGFSVVFAVGSFVFYIMTIIFIYQGFADIIRSFIHLHRHVRQSVDDERIRKFHEYGKGGKNGL